MNKQRLLSISNSLKSDMRNLGPRLFHKNIPLDKDNLNTNYKSDFAKKITETIYNASPAEYYEYALQEKHTKLSCEGALIAYSGIKTGRSPKDKRIISTDDNIWYGENSPNVKMTNETFNINRETAICYLNNQERLYVFDGFACWHREHRIKVRVISSRAYHTFFMHNMLIRPSYDELKNFSEPDIIIYNAGCFPANRFNSYMTSSTSINLNLDKKEIVILGTQYAGEMKKAIFSYLHYTMPQQNILSLHSSCNTSKNGENICLFFGLSGTGKTTLSADSSRNLIGDDEHCWYDNGVFNIEGGCYAKIIDLDIEKEKDIYECIRFGSLLENTLTDEKRNIDFGCHAITKNIRLSYPVHFMKNATVPCLANHPTNIILLTCDAFGVLPVVSKLTTEQTIYHFLNGYTAKISGTEDGILKPQATFSACYGEAFLVLHPTKYSNLLKEKIINNNVNCWLVNTGWINGPYGEGKRCDLTVTREIVSAIHDGSLLNESCLTFPVFDLQVPKKYDINKWDNQTKYNDELNKLQNLFQKNFKRF